MAQLSKKEVIESNKLLGNVLGVNAIHNLITLFDTGRIVEYIRYERELHHLDPTNVDIESKIFGTTDGNTSLLITIRKYGPYFYYIYR